MPRRVITRTPPGSTSSDRARSALTSVPGGQMVPGSDQRTPVRSASARLVCVRSALVKSSRAPSRSASARPFRRRDAEAASHALRADPVQGTGALEGQVKGTADSTVDVKDLFTGLIAVKHPHPGFAEYTDQAVGQAVGAVEVGIKAVGKFAGQLKVIVTGEAEAQVQMAGKGVIDGVGELTGEMDSGAEAAKEAQVEVALAGQIEGENQARAACDGDAKLEMTGSSIFAGAVQVAAQVTGQGSDERTVQVPVAAAVDRGGDSNRPRHEVAQDSGPDHRVTANTHPRCSIGRAERHGRRNRPRSGRRGRRITAGYPVNVHDRSPSARLRHPRVAGSPLCRVTGWPLLKRPHVAVGVTEI